jgi:hypothetical protein
VKRSLITALFGFANVAAVVITSCAQGTELTGLGGGTGTVGQSGSASSSATSATGIGGVGGMTTGPNSSSGGGSPVTTASSSSTSSFGGSPITSSSSSSGFTTSSSSSSTTAASSSSSVASSTSSSGGTGFGPCITQAEFDNQNGPFMIDFCANPFAGLACALANCANAGVNPGDIVCSPNCVCAPMPPICGTTLDAGVD